MTTPATPARDLPDDLALPLESGAEWWYWLGGRPALDFVNTLRERWRRRVETLVSGEDLIAWLQAAGLLEAGEAAIDATDAAELLPAARGLREAIDAALSAQLAGEPAPADALAEITGWLPEARLAQRLVAAGGHGAPRLVEVAPVNSLRHAVARAALDAAQMLGTAERARIRVCASETCSARFYDHSPAGRRRWCSMSGCGNREKARRHRAAQR